METLYAILKNEPPLLETRTGDVPAELGAVVEHCLEKTPSASFQSVRDLAFTLDLVARTSQTNERRGHPRRGVLGTLFPSLSTSMIGFLATIGDLCMRR